MELTATATNTTTTTTTDLPIPPIETNGRKRPHTDNDDNDTSPPPHNTLKRRAFTSGCSGGGGGGGGGGNHRFNASCNNCGRIGHLQNQCKMPIVSTGLIVFRRSRQQPEEMEYLMICRKDSLGYVDFLRGRYSPYNKSYLLNMFLQMTHTEKERLRTWTFDALWQQLWHGNVDIDSPARAHLRRRSPPEQDLSAPATSPPQAQAQAQAAEPVAWQRQMHLFGQPQHQQHQHHHHHRRRNQDDSLVRERFHLLTRGVHTKEMTYNIDTLIDESERMSPHKYIQPEWGFPKGRKNVHERDLQCALREFSEETGMSAETLKVVHNLWPFEETYTGSNYKTYKTKYYLAYGTNTHTTSGGSGGSGGGDDDGGVAAELRTNIQQSEVSDIAWCTLSECLEKIRAYNTEKRTLIQNVDNVLRTYRILT